MKKTRNNSGEALTAILVGLAVGCVVAWFSAAEKAQQRADVTGEDVAVFDMVKEEPAQSIGYPILGAAAGWGVSKLLDGGNNSKSNSRDNNVNIDSDGNVVVNIAGDTSTSVDTSNQNYNNDNSRDNITR